MNAIDAEVLLLAAGLGTRLWPLTCDRGKPAVPFLGVPLIRHLARDLLGQGFRKLVVNTHHQPGSIHDALTDAALAKLEVVYSHEPEILGTAGAIGQAVDRGLIDPRRPLLIINGKIYTSIDLRPVLSQHLASGARVTMVLMPNPAREHFREVLVEKDRIVGFGKGRVPEGPNPLLFTGIHVLAPEIVAAIPVRVADTVADIYPPHIAAGRVHAYVLPHGRTRWWEFSTLDRYLGLHLRAAAEGLCGSVVLSEGAVVDQGAVVENTVLWEHARVEGGAQLENVVVGAGVTIRAGETLRNAVVVRRDVVQEIEQGYTWDDRVVVPLPDRLGWPSAKVPSGSREET